MLFPVESPFVSIIVATLNVSYCLPRLLRSLEGQDFTCFELLIADGGSTDGTLDIINGCRLPFLEWWTSQPDNSLYEAWNRAIEVARGDWILFLGADDELYDSTVLSRFKSYTLSGQNHKYGLIYGKVLHIGLSGNDLHVGGKQWSETCYDLWRGAKMMAHQGVFHSSSLFREHGVFDGTFKISGDYDFLLRIIKKSVVGSFCEELYVAKMHYGGISSGYNNLRFFKEFIRARRKNKAPVSREELLLRMRYLIRSFLICLYGKQTTSALIYRISSLLGLHSSLPL